MPMIKFGDVLINLDYVSSVRYSSKPYPLLIVDVTPGGPKELRGDEATQTWETIRQHIVPMTDLGDTQQRLGRLEKNVAAERGATTETLTEIWGDYQKLKERVGGIEERLAGSEDKPSESQPPTSDPDAPRRFRWPRTGNVTGWHYGVYWPRTNTHSAHGIGIGKPTVQGLEWLDPEPAPTLVPACGHIEPAIPCDPPPRVESITLEWPGGRETFYAGERPADPMPAQEATAGGVVLPSEDDHGGPVS